MSTWPSGTIASATVRGVPDVLVMHHGDTWGWTSSVYAGGSLGHPDEQVTDVRPLVVLDPAEFPAFSGVDSMLRRTSVGLNDAYTELLHQIADEWERQTKPPRMAEPGWGERVTALLGAGCPREVWIHRADGCWENGCGAAMRWDLLIDPEPVGGEDRG